MTPLDYLLSVMRDEDQALDVRVDCAGKAAPYVHPRLSQVDAKMRGEFDVRAWMLQATEGDGE